MSDNQFFNKTLSNFINDYANGGAIRHYADLGYTVQEIMEHLDYPAPKKVVADILWKHYISTGKICLEKPLNVDEIEKVSYVKDYGAYGRTSMRRVVTKEKVEPKEYIPCDFGKKRYQDEKQFLSQIEQLSIKDREYILGLPWPLQTVYHEADERMKRICAVLNGQISESSSKIGANDSV